MRWRGAQLAPTGVFGESPVPTCAVAIRWAALVNVSAAALQSPSNARMLGGSRFGAHIAVCSTNRTGGTRAMLGIELVER
ncbi:hypothetical protein Rwratislav_01037 [Rhodococcus wratislaviensis IFP 2016]|uniref:Uncharacterized protein n=1 Tax=Rhodococcus opacus M213 TaxID=1129896 RepID=K8XIJ0_RHOOP|nr:hypothetical protein WSS_A17426 [Rhodococcus opacus M213]ELB94987.1 hypothetical protein Rwratislav_01037 [Rhodococcus wratislaviensis IFP 2016]